MNSSDNDRPARPRSTVDNAILVGQMATGMRPKDHGPFQGQPTMAQLLGEAAEIQADEFARAVAVSAAAVCMVEVTPDIGLDYYSRDELDRALTLTERRDINVEFDGDEAYKNTERILLNARNSKIPSHSITVWSSNDQWAGDDSDRIVAFQEARGLADHFSTPVAVVWESNDESHCLFVRPGSDRAEPVICSDYIKAHCIKIPVGAISRELTEKELRKAVDLPSDRNDKTEMASFLNAAASGDGGYFRSLSTSTAISNKCFPPLERRIRDLAKRSLGIAHHVSTTAAQKRLGDELDMLRRIQKKNWSIEHEPYEGISR